MSYNTFHKTAENLVVELNKQGFDAYIWALASTGSAYIRFKDQRMCSIRIGDHDGREKYLYKFNLRSDIKKAAWRKENDTWRYYAPVSSTALLIEQLLKRKETVKSWPAAKYQYGIPSFKRNRLK